MSQFQYVPNPPHLPRLHISRGPVSRANAYISISIHPFSVITLDSPIVYHFSNRLCAEMTADYLVANEYLGVARRSMVKIYNRDSKQTYERIGSSWI